MMLGGVKQGLLLWRNITAKIAIFMAEYICHNRSAETQQD